MPNGWVPDAAPWMSTYICANPGRNPIALGVQMSGAINTADTVGMKSTAQNEI